MIPAKLFGTIAMIGIAMSWQAGFAQTEFQNANEKLVKAYYTSFEKNDWSTMEQILADGFTFTSPLDDHIKLKLFKERCWPNAQKIKRFEIDKMVINGDVAFVITNGWTTEGKLFRNSDFFKFKDGKISEYECFFGPGVNYPNSGK